MIETVKIETLEREYAAAMVAAEPDGATVTAIEASDRTCGTDYQGKIRRLGDRWKNILATPAPHDHLSEDRMAIICALVKRRFTPGEIIATLEASPWYADLARRKGERHAEHLIATEIAKAQAVVTPFPEESPNAPIDLSGIRHRRNGTNGSAAHEPASEDPAARPQSLPRFPRTDTGSAELFAHLFGDRLRYDHRRGEWLVYGPHWWQRDQDGEVPRLAIEAARQRYVAALNIPDETERQAEAKFAIGSENRQKVEAMLAMARALKPIADNGDGWDADAYLMGAENGVIDLRTGELRAGVPEDRMSRHAPVLFDAGAECPTFERFAAEILPDPDVLAYVQELAGVALTGDTSEQILPFLHGQGANGKTTMARTLMQIIGRDYARQAAPGLLLRKRGESHPTEIADLFGARLVVSIEVEDGRGFAEALIKQMTGGDFLKARFMRGDFFQWMPTHKVWLLANHRPIVRGTDLAIWRRIRLIPFEVTIPESQQDQHLAERLMSEASGILNWAIAGCLRWQRQGLTTPAAVLAATGDYREDSDPLQPFIEARCYVAEAAKSGANALFKAYKAWASDAGLSDHEALGSRHFGTKMSERFARKSVDGRRWYFGVGIRTEDSDVG